MEDDLRAVMDDDAPSRRYTSHQRSGNWLAKQIALGIIMGGCALWVLDLLIKVLAATAVIKGISGLRLH